MRVVFAYYQDVQPLSGLRESFPQVEFVFAPEDDDIRSALPDAEVLVVSGKKYNAAFNDMVAAAGGKLEWIQLTSAGVDNQLKLALPRGVKLVRGASLWTQAVAEHTMALMLALARGLPTVFEKSASHEWDYGAVAKATRTLEGKRLLILGGGDIGKDIARKAKAFDMRVTAVRRTPQPAGGDFDVVASPDRLVELLPEADVVVSVLPLTEETHHLLGAEQFELMKESAFFINVGRGPVVDEAALAEALVAGQIAGAGLDVFEKEPLSADSQLWDLPNAIVAPHVGGVTEHGPRNLSRLVETNLQRYLDGQPLLYEVEPERGY